MLLLLCTAGGLANGNITARKAHQMIKASRNIIVVDVRRGTEFAQGHLANALNIDFYDKDFRSMIASLPHSKRIIVYCATGRRSALTLNVLDSLGYQRAYNMIGGYKAWTNKKLRTTLEVQ